MTSEELFEILSQEKITQFGGTITIVAPDITIVRPGREPDDEKRED